MSRNRRRAAAPRPSVVFDIGGVLTAGHDPAPALHALLGGDLGTLRAALWEHRAAYDRGDLDPRSYWTRVAGAVGIEDPSDAEVAELAETDARYFLQLDPEARALLHDLARNEVRIALLSNASAAYAEHLRRADWFEAVTVAIISGEEGVLKPDRGIFEILLEVLAHETGGVSRPDAVIYFDDQPANVEAARQLGIDAHVWPRNGGYAGEAGADGISAPGSDGTEPRHGAQIAREILAARGVTLD